LCVFISLLKQMTTPNVYEEMTGQGTNCERNLDNGNPVEGAKLLYPSNLFCGQVQLFGIFTNGGTYV
ncbi:MAG: hypothetical protein QOK79_11005, partial [Nitrososphaeraceae archaeon]|nr:hypothetical protein [Nitrososphaeraceae archaeon]MDW3614207.1 hypothetical protein [Nitrososphaeraceae archaeon]